MPLVTVCGIVLGVRGRRIGIRSPCGTRVGVHKVLKWMLGCVGVAQLDAESSCTGHIHPKCRRVVDFEELFQVSLRLQLDPNLLRRRTRRCVRGEDLEVGKVVRNNSSKYRTPLPRVWTEIRDRSQGRTSYWQATTLVRPRPTNRSFLRVWAEGTRTRTSVQHMRRRPI